MKQNSGIQKASIQAGSQDGVKHAPRLSSRTAFPIFEIQRLIPSMAVKTSAGLLMFRRRGRDIEVLLAHPGGPFFKKKDDGHWTVPKGEAGEGEDLLERAKIEFEEEIGIPASGEWIELGCIRQKGGKIVHAWAFEGTLPDHFEVRSNTCLLEWPPRSGKKQEFPEVDRAEFFSLKKARVKIKETQIPLLDRLAAIIEKEPNESK